MPLTSLVIPAVTRLWTRAWRGAAPAARTELQLVAGKGVVGDHSFGGKRHVTLIFEDDWYAAAATLGREVDPAGRRANLLLTGGGGQRLVGRTVRVGPVRVAIHGITRPCEVMDRASPGLRAALEPDGRSGVWGTVLDGGRVQAGDVLTVEG
jgi:MOSC domain-containing protein YiiM